MRDWRTAARALDRTVRRVETLAKRRSLELTLSSRPSFQKF